MCLGNIFESQGDFPPALVCLQDMDPVGLQAQQGPLKYLAFLSAPVRVQLDVGFDLDLLSGETLEIFGFFQGPIETG